MTDSTIGNIHKYLGGHRGRLYQQGNVIKGWKPRFFVLERRRIKIFADETLFRINGEVAINEGTVVYDIPGEVEGRKFLFYVSSRDASTQDEVLYLSAQSRRDKLEWMEAIMDAVHNGFKLVHQPELWIEDFYPAVDLSVSYERNSVYVEYGNMLKPSMVEDVPSVTLRFADPSTIYSLVLVDLDSIHASEENKTVYLHWGVVNIHGSDLSTGIEVAPYVSPAPEFDSGLHRFFFLLFTQNFVLTSSQIAETAEAFQQREHFSYLDWVRSRNLGDPAGLNGFYAGWEDYCAVLHEKRQYTPSDGYLLTRQDAFLQKEAEAIWVEDAKMRLFQDLTLTDIFPASVDVSTAVAGSIALDVRYDEEVVAGGATIAAEATRFAPQVRFPPHQAEISGFVAGTNAIAVDFGLYTLLMLDADAALDFDNGKGNYQCVHWVVINIPQSNVTEGTEVVPYKPPAPTYGSGLHRYVFCLYKQKKAFTPQQVDSSRAALGRRYGVRTYDWVRSYPSVLLNIPVGLEAFLCEWDESVESADGRITAGPSRRGSEDEYSIRNSQAGISVGNRSSASSIVSTRRDAVEDAPLVTSDNEAEAVTESEQESVEARPLSAPVKPQRILNLQPLGRIREESKPEPVPSALATAAAPAAAPITAPVTAPAPAPVPAPVTEAAPQVPPVRTSFGSILMEADHGLFERAPSQERFAGGKASAPASPVNVHVSQLLHAGAEAEDMSRKAERKACQSVTATDIPNEDSKLITADFAPKPKSTPPQQQQVPVTPPQTTPISPKSPKRQAEAPAPPAQDPTSPVSPKPAEEVDWLREQEAREKREKKKALQRQREAELEQFEAARMQEEQKRRDAAQQEERRRLAKQQEDDFERLVEEKRRRAKADAEKLRKQEEMRRAMQEHEQAEAERVRIQEARAEAERQKQAQEKAEEQRRLEARQQDELRRAMQRQQEAAAADAERQRQLEERAVEEKRRIMKQRSEDEAEQARQSEAQRMELKRRIKLQQMARQEEDEQLRQQAAEDRERQAVLRRQEEAEQQYRQQPRPVAQQPLVPAIKLRTSFGNVLMDSNHGLIEAPPAQRYGGVAAARAETAAEQQSSSDSNPETNMHSEYENESVLSALTNATSVASKLQRSVSFATIISTTSDDSYWINSPRDTEGTLSSKERDRSDRRQWQERDRSGSNKYMEQEMLENPETEEMRRARMQELEEQRLRAEAAEAKRRQKMLWEQQQHEVERLQAERMAAAEAKRQDDIRAQQRALQKQQEEQATLDLLRMEAEAEAREAERQRQQDEAEARRLQEEHDYEEEMRLLHMQLEEEHSVHSSFIIDDPKTYEHEEEEEGEWNGYDPELDAVADGGNQLIEDHLEYFNDRDEKESADTPTPEVVEEPAGYETPAPLLRMPSAEVKTGPSPSSSPSRSINSSAAPPSIQIPQDSYSSTSNVNSLSSRSRDRAESESSSKLSADGSAALSPEAASSKTSDSAPAAPRSPMSSPATRAKNQDKLNAIAAGVAKARDSGDLCRVFGITTRSVFDGDKLKKKYSSDFMAKDSAVWIDPQRRSLHWGKKPLDAMNSKFIMLEKTNANQPASMRPAGENKGTCKSVSLLDASTFKVTLWSDKVFEGKLLGDGVAERTNDWVKVINSFQRSV